MIRHSLMRLTRGSTYDAQIELDDGSLAYRRTFTIVSVAEGQGAKSVAQRSLF